MNIHYLELQGRLRMRPAAWLVTGCAGFIGSHLLQALLALGQEVIGLDNFATGRRRNLEEVRDAVGAAAWRRFRFIEADIRDMRACRAAARDAQHVLHQAALGSVPRSLADPLTCNAVNVGGFLNMLEAAREAGAASFTYAASSAVYGDHPALPRLEERIGRALSPYAVSKLADELYAGVIGRCHGFHAIGLRYFNVFGRRQDPDGPYAAVIPRWTAAMIRGQRVVIHGDGSASRDFCHVDNVVQANLLAALAAADARGAVYNVAVGESATLLQLFDSLALALREHGVTVGAGQAPLHQPPRPGDVQHSLADIGRARSLLGYQPATRLRQGLAQAMPWYLRREPCVAASRDGSGA